MPLLSVFILQPIEHITLPKVRGPASHPRTVVRDTKVSDAAQWKERRAVGRVGAYYSETQGAL
jgi:hypothetical protein